MSGPPKTAIVTGASQGIGAGIVKGFVERGFNVVANSRKVTQSTEVAASHHVALVDGHIGEPATAAKIVETALSRFQSIDVLVNNAGIFFTKPFTDYTAEDFKSLVATNVEGFLYVTQLSIKQMLAQKTGGSIVTITAALARNPIRGVQAIAPITSLQPRYSLLHREIEAEILPFAARNNIGVIAYSPMASGLLTGAMTGERIAGLPADDWRKRHPDFREPQLHRNLMLVRLLRTIGKRRGYTPAEVAIAWVLHNPAVTGAIVGARRPGQVRGIVGAAELRLSPREVAEIEAFFAKQAA
jgi:NAD(P)-dependent dehydrogenase (short-subunit alcohol dehydrogenase family)